MDNTLENLPNDPVVAAYCRQSPAHCALLLNEVLRELAGERRALRIGLKALAKAFAAVADNASSKMEQNPLYAEYASWLSQRLHHAMSTNEACLEKFQKCARRLTAQASKKIAAENPGEIGTLRPQKHFSRSRR